MKLFKKGLSILLILTMMLLPISAMADAEPKDNYIRGELTYLKTLQAFLDGRKIDTNITYSIDNMDLSKLMNAGLIDEKGVALAEAISLTLSEIGFNGNAALVDNGLSAGFGVSMKGENIFDMDFNVNHEEFKFMTSLMPDKLFVYYLEDSLNQLKDSLAQFSTAEDFDSFAADEIRRYGAVLYGWMLMLDEPTELTTTISPFDMETEVTVTTMLITQEKLRDLLVTFVNTLAMDPYFKDAQVNEEQTLSAMLYEILPDLMKAELADIEISHFTDETGNMFGGVLTVGEEFSVQVEILSGEETVQGNIFIIGTNNYMDIALEGELGEESTKISFEMLNALDIEGSKLTQTSAGDIEFTGDSTEELAESTMKVNQQQTVEDSSMEINMEGTGRVLTTVKDKDFTKTQQSKFTTDMAFNEVQLSFDMSVDAETNSSKATSYAQGKEFEMITLNTIDATTMEKLEKEVKSNVMLLSFKVLSLLPSELMTAISEIERTEDLPPELSTNDEVVIETVENEEVVAE